MRHWPNIGFNVGSPSAAQDLNWVNVLCLLGIAMQLVSQYFMRIYTHVQPRVFPTVFWIGSPFKSDFLSI